MNEIHFDTAFKALTGNSPFPWQRALYKRFISDRRDNIPPSCNLPTGLGKTSVIAVWLIALANGATVPRRLVYVVNRRTVVDQTTDEVVKYRDGMHDCPELVDRLLDICCPTPTIPYRHQPLALSTLRGQFADNREWSADPSRPAVICGTVDMIGSRLLFSGYGIGFKQKPLHAGFLGQDSLLVHDEAHLEPAFQCLIKAIEKEQHEGERTGILPWPKLRVMELTATSRSGGDAFPNKEEAARNDADPTVQERVSAWKALHLHELRDEKKLAEQVAELALQFKDSGRAVLVFARTVDDVMKIRDKLPDDSVETLTGTMRGKERDELVENATFARFLPKAPRGEKTVYLVCTSAGEVGVNISADDLVCDLSTFESMAQRFGRVNRFGTSLNTVIHVVHPTEFDADKPYEIAREKTLRLLESIPPVVPFLPCVSPVALSGLDATARQAAFAPLPTILPVTDILFDAWALTTIRDKLPGRPKVEPYLHGLPTDWQPPETQVAWRDEVSELNVTPWTEWSKSEFETFATGLLDDYPLKPQELLKDVTSRVFDRLKKLKAPRESPLWIQSEDGEVMVASLGQLVDADKDFLNYVTVILPPSLGGLSAQGMLDEKSTAAIRDVSDETFADRERTKRLRVRVWNDDEAFDKNTKDMRCIRTIRYPGPEDDEDAVGRVWYWYERGNEGEKTAPARVAWGVHVADVVRETEDILVNSTLADDLKKAVIVAAQFHDHGKRRKLFQRVLGNSQYPAIVLAKSGGKSGGRVAETYRHEFGSLLDIRKEKEFDELPDEGKELVLHLIAAHHGRARPHFSADEAFDPERPQTDVEAMAMCVPRRFARLQRKYGRWGLAYLESLLRAADWAASAKPSQYLEGDK